MLYTVKEYSTAFNLSRQAIYKQIDKGTLKSYKNADGITVIEVDTADNQTTTNADQIQEQINLLKDIINDLKNDKQTANERIKELQQIIINEQTLNYKLSTSLQQVEQEKRLLIEDKNKSFFKKIFTWK